MKKLMVALTAVALGACAWAEEAVTPTLTGKVEFKNEAAGSWTRGTDWAYSGNDAAEALKIVGNEGSRVLEIKTGTAVLTRNVKQGGGATNICEGIYIDTVIDFQNQALDEVPTATNDEKIAIFVLDTTEIEGAPAGTNVYVMAGYGPSGKALYRLVGFDSSFIASGPRRVVVKSYADVIEGEETTRTGFLVYIQNGANETLPLTPCKVHPSHVYAIQDGAVNWTTPVNTDTDHLGLTTGFQTTAAVARWVNISSPSLFLSMPTSTDRKQGNLSAVDFVGNAQIASVEVTATNPGFEPDLFTMTLAATGVEVTLVSGEGVNQGVNLLPGGALTATTDGATVKVNVTLTGDNNMVTASGPADLTEYEPGKWSFTFANGGTVSFTGAKAAATVNDTKYPTIEAAIEAANAKGGTLKLAQATIWPETDSTLTANNLTLDLAGQTLTLATESTVLGVDASGSLTITDSASNGKIDGEGKVGNLGALVIEKGIFDVAVVNYNQIVSTAKVTVKGGSFLKSCNSTEGETPAFTLAASVAQGLEVVTEGNYWKVQTKAAAQVALTIENATGATISGVEEGTVTEGSNITFTVTAANGYKNLKVLVNGEEVSPVDGSYSIIVGKTDITITVTATKITWATLTITPVDNCTIAVSNGNVAVASGAKFDVDDEVKLTVTRTPAEGYVLDGCAASETITMRADQTVTAAVKLSSGTTYPSYIPADASAETKAKFDAWVTAKASGDRDASGANMEAFLLNVAPDAAATEKSNFKVTAITVNADGTVTVTTTTENSAGDAYNGTVKVKGKVNLTDADWIEKDATHKFFKAFLVVE